MRDRWIKPLFWVAAAYDLVLGIVFLLFFKSFYAWLQIEPPNHDGYVQFAALLVAIFGVGFVFVALDPPRNRNIIIMGVLLKLSYAGVVLGHHFLGSIPIIWVPFAWIDLAFAVLFLGALSALRARVAG
ncbi:MAG: hypothetical protein NTW86_31710 [Candidatus Sumerlaeota bacterium]|nr:hypothetical protein [Candidatus Sumerlaeota bacterium]